MSYDAAFHSGSDAQEEPFGLDEIFYSRTDKRGVILSGNDVFRRVSGFTWDRLIGAPHRIVRHPDTPRAVFHLFWKTIQQGKPICAVVKNRTASGGWYWVVAVAVPLSDGYISVRIKPTGELFARTRQIYASLTAAEQSKTLSPERSCERMLEQIAELGFADYAEFMAALLDQCLVAHEAAVGHVNAARRQALDAVQANLGAAQQAQQALVTEFDTLQTVPTNMRIIASRLEPSGGPISAISENYKFASTEIARRIEVFASSEHNQCRIMVGITGEAMLMSNIARLFSELPRQFSQEDTTLSPVDFDSELAFLSEIEAQYRQAARATMSRAEAVAGELSQSSAEIRRMTLGLDTIRVMGRVESGRLGPVGIGLSTTVDQLDDRHAVIARHLQRLMDLSSAIRVSIGQFQRNGDIG